MRRSSAVMDRPLSCAELARLAGDVRLQRLGPNRPTVLGKQEGIGEIIVPSGRPDAPKEERLG